MTVAVACLFTWKPNNAPPELAVLTMADRMITREATEWEPAQTKTWVVNDRIHVLISGGDYSVHSKAVLYVENSISGDESLTVHSFAARYRDALAEQQRLDAEIAYLRPLGLTISDLNSGRGLDPQQVERLTHQMQNHPTLDAAALIVGCDDRQGHIYTVDCRGFQNESDIGWAVIGSGYYQAASEFQRYPYRKGADHGEALFTAFRAKKAGEAASYVGAQTDIFQITRSGYAHLNKVVVPTLEQADRNYTISVAIARVTALRQIAETLIPTEQKSEASGLPEVQSSVKHPI